MSAPPPSIRLDEPSIALSAVVGFERETEELGGGVVCFGLRAWGLKRWESGEQRGGAVVWVVAGGIVVSRSDLKQGGSG